MGSSIGCYSQEREKRGMGSLVVGEEMDGKGNGDKS